MMSSDDRRYWSVTTIISGGVPSPALTTWAVNTTAEYAVTHRHAWASLADTDPQAAIDLIRKARFRRSSNAMARGSDVHAWIDARIKGAPAPAVDDAIRPWIDNADRFLDAFQPEFELAEAPLFSLRYRYAGTLDAVARIGDRTLILDYKTHDKTMTARSRPPYDSTALQLAAYRHADVISIRPAHIEEWGGRRYYVWSDEDEHMPMPDVDGAAVVTIGPTPGDVELVPVRTDEPVWAAFLHAREVFRWSLTLSREVIGAPVRPPAADRRSSTCV